MKVIHIISLALREEYTRDEWYKIDSIAHRYATKMRQYTDRYEVECWWTERRVSAPVVHQVNGVVFRAFPASRYRFPYRYMSLSLLKTLREECKEGQVLIFLHGFLGKWTTLIPLFIKNVPIVLQQHGEAVRYSKKRLIRRPWLFPFSILEQFAYKNIDRFFLLHRQAEKELRGYVDPSKIVIRSCGVDFNLFRPMDKIVARGSLGLDPTRRYILFVGRINERKGARYLLEAMPSVLRDYPSTELLLIGEARRGETLADLKEFIQRLALEDNVNFLGKIDNAKLPLYYNAADVFVLPSLTEGLGLVLVEAAACNCPIIGTRVGGIVDLMETLGKGILVPPRSPEALALAIKTVFE
ncbi:MAG TPA: glycosyltransferase, partial [Candidatus Hypogeohydataceae bacterium YC38]